MKNIVGCISTSVTHLKLHTSLKDPLFFTSSVFLKTPKRIASLAMIMGLCLLVYSLGQRKLREALEITKKSVKNQLGKLTKTPTLRWFFQCFQSIHLLTIDGEQEITNLTKERKAILHLLHSVKNIICFFRLTCGMWVIYLYLDKYIVFIASFQIIR